MGLWLSTPQTGSAGGSSSIIYHHPSCTIRVFRHQPNLALNVLIHSFLRDRSCNHPAPSTSDTYFTSGDEVPYNLRPPSPARLTYETPYPSLPPRFLPTTLLQICFRVSARPTSTEMKSSPSDVRLMEAVPTTSDENSCDTLDGLRGQTASKELSVRMCVQLGQTFESIALLENIGVLFTERP
jgi:hypothetical protein